MCTGSLLSLNGEIKRAKWECFHREWPGDSLCISVMYREIIMTSLGLYTRVEIDPGVVQIGTRTFGGFLGVSTDSNHTHIFDEIADF